LFCFFVGGFPVPGFFFFFFFPEMDPI